MKIINQEEKCPSEFFIFVNELNPVAEHNFRLIGKLSSAAMSSVHDEQYLKKYLDGKIRYLPYEPCHSDQLAVSPYFLTAINEYRVEYDAEWHREKFFPFYPSRLSALYAFGDLATCEVVAEKYRWDIKSVHRFRLIESPLNRVIRVNMEHISLARFAYRNSSLMGVEQLWHGYWSGVGEVSVQLPAPGFTRKDFSSGVIWEYLIEGVVERII